MSQSIDLEILNRPISADHPTGEDCRVDGQSRDLFYKLKDQRRTARNNERQRMQDGDINFISASEWREVKSIADELLKTYTKDIEIVCYLLEALTRLNGFDGIASGFTLIYDYCEKYLSELHPLADEDGYTTTFAALASLNGEQQPGGLITPIKSIAITPDNYATWQYEEITRNQSAPADDNKHVLTRDAFQVSLAQAGDEYICQLVNDIGNAIQAVEKVEDLLTHQVQDAAPPLHYIIKSLKACLQAVNDLQPKNNDSQEIGDSIDEQINEKKLRYESDLSSKSKAVEQLKQCVEFFKLHEPHSPISYTLERCINWINMSLPELMQDIMATEDTYFDYCRMVGIAVNNNQDNYSDTEFQNGPFNENE